MSINLYPPQFAREIAHLELPLGSVTIGALLLVRLGGILGGILGGVVLLLVLLRLLIEDHLRLLNRGILRDTEAEAHQDLHAGCKVSRVRRRESCADEGDIEECVCNILGLLVFVVVLYTG